MQQVTKESVNWHEYAPARNCENCQYGRRIDVYQCVYRCELNDWNTGALSICDKWTKKAEWRNGKGDSHGGVTIEKNDCW